MNELLCDVAMAALVRTVEDGSPLNAEVRLHLRECNRCRKVLDGARALEQSLEDERAGEALRTTAPAIAIESVAEEARRRQRERIMGRWFLVAVSLLLFVLIVTPFLVDNSSGTHELILVSGMGLAIAILFAAPIVGLMSFARTELQGRPRLYKRLGPGRQVSGVCLGLAERTGWPAIVFRLGFVALLFANGFGFWLYLLFDLAMPVHPGDRQYLLRFRIARAWRMFLARQSAG